MQHEVRVNKLPRGSQKPRGAWAPRASSKLILRAEDEAMRAEGAKAATDTREARMAMYCMLILRACLVKSCVEGGRTRNF